MEQRIPPSVQTRASNFAAHHWMMQANEVLLKVRTVVLWLEKLVSGVIWEAVEERAVFWSGTGQSGGLVVSLGAPVLQHSCLQQGVGLLV